MIAVIIGSPNLCTTVREVSHSQLQIEGEYAIYVAILILLGIACLFTVAGGLSAVIWTDFVQTVLMIIGAFMLTGIGAFVLPTDLTNDTLTFAAK